MNYRFSTLGKFQGPQHPLQTSGTGNPKQKTFSFHYVTEKDCHDAIRALGRKKPIGLSNIPAWAIKNSSSVIFPRLNFLVNYCIKLSCFPNELKRAHVVPLHKKDDPEEPNNYRPISITPCLSKIIETILRDQICQYLHDNKLLSKNQYGFRKKFSTIDSLLFCTEFIRNKTDNNNFVTAAFLDLSKAFDSINYDILDIKLGNLGFDENSKNLLRSFVTNRRKSVVLQDCISDELMLHRGVPQGTVLGPLLFNLYINDMATRVDNETELIQYADDTVILTFDTSIDKSKIKLEQNANKLIRLFHEHHLTINTSKTEFMIFGKSKRKDFSEQIILDSIPIDEKPEVKYLGVHIDSNLTFQEEVKLILRKMARGIKTI